LITAKKYSVFNLSEIVRSKREKTVSQVASTVDRTLFARKFELVKAVKMVLAEVDLQCEGAASQMGPQHWR
jgi:hypothetical protein